MRGSCRHGRLFDPCEDTPKTVGYAFLLHCEDTPKTVGYASSFHLEKNGRLRLFVPCEESPQIVGYAFLLHVKNSKMVGYALLLRVKKPQNGRLCLFAPSPPTLFVLIWFLFAAYVMLICLFCAFLVLIWCIFGAYFVLIQVAYAIPPTP